MPGAIGLVFTLLVAGACARAGFRYIWARLQELREAFDIVEPGIQFLSPASQAIVPLRGDVPFVSHSSDMAMSTEGYIYKRSPSGDWVMARPPEA